ncbi:hypothetical protein [Streptomyces sp. NPDC059489]|uniref:hypothetical protein n=2 Tax=unclassified Streptomyces TaxID=2593676 RepID=UPI0036AF5B35
MAGRPVCGEDNGFVFDCLASIAMNPNVDEGDDISYKAANGRQCGFRKGCPTFNGYDLEINFSSVSPEFIEITTANPVVFGFDGKPIGYDDCSVQCRTGFALEFWADALGEDVCEAEGTGGAWLYYLIPWVTNGCSATWRSAARPSPSSWPVPAAPVAAGARACTT